MHTRAQNHAHIHRVESCTHAARRVMHSLSGATHILEGLLSLLQPLVGVLQLGGGGAQLVLQLDHLLLEGLHLLLGLEKGGGRTREMVLRGYSHSGEPSPSPPASGWRSSASPEESRPHS
jgi:hypothetical protein